MGEGSFVSDPDSGSDLDIDIFGIAGLDVSLHR